LFVTDAGKLWATGRKFLKRVGVDSKECTHVAMPHPEDGPLSVVRAWASQVKEEQMALVLVKNAKGQT
jgi:hypothetical protein